MPAIVSPNFGMLGKRALEVEKDPLLEALAAVSAGLSIIPRDEESAMNEPETESHFTLSLDTAKTETHQLDPVPAESTPEQVQQIAGLTVPQFALAISVACVIVFLVALITVVICLRRHQKRNAGLFSPSTSSVSSFLSPSVFPDSGSSTDVDDSEDLDMADKKRRILDSLSSGDEASTQESWCEKTGMGIKLRSDPSVKGGTIRVPSPMRFPFHRGRSLSGDTIISHMEDDGIRRKAMDITTPPRAQIPLHQPHQKSCSLLLAYGIAQPLPLPRSRARVVDLEKALPENINEQRTSETVQWRGAWGKGWDDSTACSNAMAGMTQSRGMNILAGSTPFLLFAFNDMDAIGVAIGLQYYSSTPVSKVTKLLRRPRVLTQISVTSFTRSRLSSTGFGTGNTVLKELFHPSNLMREITNEIVLSPVP
ncbi:hypothetical protein EX30DRAFT_351725 [Ascodesmis nigricans]|uniref:Uncharacterized protein n=1 Tax=Ascodesmis nigricans TaxID=341454 RepID=A0A4S2MKV8_9PEZI|nr:hypothetical protein EX30DRAFT_351725 [Ascodesmis nigricans]